MNTNTLTPYVITYMAHRSALGSYGPKSQRVVQPRLRSLADHFGRRPLHHLTDRAIGAWLESLGRLAPNSRASYLASVRAFTVWLVDNSELKLDPCRKIPRAKRARPVPRAQTSGTVTAILGACRDDRERAIVWLMVGLGLRRMEVAGLRWEHYEERERMLLIASSKNGNQRVLPVTQEVSLALARVRGRNGGPIIASKTDPTQPISAERVGGIVTQIITRAGVKAHPYDGVSGHALRHTCASDVLDQCQDLRIVQEVLGHQHLSTTAIYLRRANAGQLREAMEGRTYEPAVAGVVRLVTGGRSRPDEEAA